MNLEHINDSQNHVHVNVLTVNTVCYQTGYSLPTNKFSDKRHFHSVTSMIRVCDYVW